MWHFPISETHLSHNHLHIRITRFSAPLIKYSIKKVMYNEYIPSCCRKPYIISWFDNFYCLSPSTRRQPAPAESGYSQGFFLSSTLLIMLHPLIHDVPSYCLREFLLAIVTFFSIKAHYFQRRFNNVNICKNVILIQMYFVCVVIYFHQISLYIGYRALR